MSAVADTVVVRLAAARRADRVRRRAGLVPVAVRPAPRAGLPRLRHRPDRRRPRGRSRRGTSLRRAAAATSAARLAVTDAACAHQGRVLVGSFLFVLGFTAVFVSFGALFGGLGAALLRVPGRDHPRARRRHDRRVGLVFIGFVPGLQREWRLHRRAVGRAGGRAAARRALRPRLDPVHRPDARRRADPRFHRGERRPRRAADAAYCLGLGLPFLLVGLLVPPRAGRDRLCEAPLASPVMRIGGGMLVLIGRAAGHRAVGRPQSGCARGRAASGCSL